MLGDVLSDLVSACTGTIGVAPSANINPTGPVTATRAAVGIQ
ncbi:isocitrate/isopropylmalate family dehydrogenase [Zobellella sp. An-6]